VSTTVLNIGNRERGDRSPIHESDERMKPAIMLVCVALLCNGCVPLIAGAITSNALERNADRKETHESHRHRERMRELDLQERLMDRQYPQGGGDAGIVRDNPY
jgi:hypothetical protein